MCMLRKISEENGLLGEGILRFTQRMKLVNDIGKAAMEQKVL